MASACQSLGAAALSARRTLVLPSCHSLWEGSYSCSSAAHLPLPSSGAASLLISTLYLQQGVRLTFCRHSLLPPSLGKAKREEVRRSCLAFCKNPERVSGPHSPLCGSSRSPASRSTAAGSAPPPGRSGLASETRNAEKLTRRRARARTRCPTRAHTTYTETHNKK